MPQAAPPFIQHQPFAQASFQQQQQQFPMLPFGQYQHQPFVPPTTAVAGQVGSRNKRKKKKGGQPGQVVQQPQFPQQPDQFLHPQVAMPVGVPAGAVESVTSVPEVAAGLDVPVTSEPGLISDAIQSKGKKSGKCWKCAVDSHATKDCTVLHYCLFCDNFKHPTLRCLSLRLPEPSAFVTG
jgi:hypothetical protein